MRFFFFFIMIWFTCFTASGLVPHKTSSGHCRHDIYMLNSFLKIFAKHGGSGCLEKFCRWHDLVTVTVVVRQATIVFPTANIRIDVWYCCWRLFGDTSLQYCHVNSQALRVIQRIVKRKNYIVKDGEEAMIYFFK